MTRKEFEEKWDKKFLRILGYVVGEKIMWDNCVNCYMEDDKWFVRDIGERQEISMLFEGTEEEVFEKLDKMVTVDYEIEKKYGRM